MTIPALPSDHSDELAMTSNEPVAVRPLLPAVAFHPSVIVRDEMDARDWSLKDFVQRIPGDYEANRLAWELYFSIGPDDPDVILGGMVDHLVVALGIDAEIWVRSEATWREWFKARRASLSSEPADAKLLRQCADWIDEAYGSGVRTDSFVHHLRVLAGKLDALSSSESSTDKRDAERWRDFLRSAFCTVNEDGNVCIGVILDEQDNMRDEFPAEMRTLDNDWIHDGPTITRLFDARPFLEGDPSSRPSEPAAQSGAPVPEKP